MKHNIAIIDESAENAELLSKLLPCQYELVLITPYKDSTDVRSFKDKEIVFINMDKNQSLYFTLFKAIKSEYFDCKIVWMSKKSGSALTAFEEHADAFMLLPINNERIIEVFKRLSRIN